MRPAQLRFHPNSHGILCFAGLSAHEHSPVNNNIAPKANFTLSTGKADSLTETPFEVARREAHEEIGLPLTNTKLPPGYTIEHLCEMPANLAKTELGVRPCVAYLSPPPFSSASSSSSSSDSNNSVEETMIPRLDPKEVAAYSQPHSTTS
jgi:8-oxo-dGTP pyrophosphatase MutT (NUDIX family)